MHSAVIAHCSLDAINLRSHKFARRAASAFSSIKLFASHSQNDNPLVYLANVSGCWSSISANILLGLGKSELRTRCSRCSRGRPRRNRIYAIRSSPLLRRLHTFLFFTRSIHSLGIRPRRSALHPLGVTQPAATTQNAQPEWAGNRIRSSTANSIVGADCKLKTDASCCQEP